MKNGIMKFIENYGHLSFKEKEFTEIDAAIFATMSYLDFETVVSDMKDKISLNIAFYLINNKLKNKEILKKGKFSKDIYNIFEKMANCNRYKDILLYGYVYKTGFSLQFGALSFVLDDGTTVVSYEGTDDRLDAWREDAEFGYKTFTDAEEEALRYFKRSINIFTKRVILVGHSKGGHLALITGMYTDFIRRKKIVNIYNLDGPGLRKEQIESNKYLNISDKLIHIVPNYSVIGLLLRHKGYICVKSNRMDLYAHSCFTWLVNDDKFERTKISKLSKKLDESIVIWLDQHSKEQREKITNDVFDYLQDAGIENVSEMKKIKMIVYLAKNTKKIDKETRDLLLNFVEFNLHYLVDKE